MSIFQQRTDLAMEARELAMPNGGEISGVLYEELNQDGVISQKLTVTSQEGANAIGKPIGTYYTTQIASVMRRESESFGKTVDVLSDIIQTLAGQALGKLTLVVGLGNRDITPDNVGPLCAQSVLVTRHLKEKALEGFEQFSPVAVITPGVMGTSGIESADYIKWVCDNLKPSLVIVVDALAAKELDRLCRTVQLTDTGITPGSGVGNSRAAVNAQTLGVPVIAIGVPTVVDIKSMIAGILQNESQNKAAQTNEMIVTPRNIDSEVACAGRLVAYAINLALHKDISIEDVDMLVG